MTNVICVIGEMERMRFDLQKRVKSLVSVVTLCDTAKEVFNQIETNYLSDDFCRNTSCKSCIVGRHCSQIKDTGLLWKLFVNLPTSNQLNTESGDIKKTIETVRCIIYEITINVVDDARESCLVDELDGEISILLNKKNLKNQFYEQIF